MSCRELRTIITVLICALTEPCKQTLPRTPCRDAFRPTCEVPYADGRLRRFLTLPLGSATLHSLYEYYTLLTLGTLG